MLDKVLLQVYMAVYSVSPSSVYTQVGILGAYMVVFLVFHVELDKELDMELAPVWELRPVGMELTAVPEYKEHREMDKLVSP